MSIFQLEPKFDLDEANTEAKGIVEKILALPAKDRLWLVCLNRHVRNAHVGSALANKSGRRIVKTDTNLGEKSGKVPIKSAAHMTRSKKAHSVVPVKSIDYVQSVSSDSIESPKYEKTGVFEKHDKGLEMSSNQLFAKGICQFFTLLTYISLAMCLSVVMLLYIEPCFLVVEYNPPVIKPVLFSTKDLFSKRARDEKSAETDSSK